MIPVNRAVVIKDGNEEYYADGQILLRNMMASNNYTNPLTGKSLTAGAIEQLRTYRLKSVRVVLVSDMRIKEFSNIFSFTVDGYQEVIDLYTECIRKSSISTGALSNTIIKIDDYGIDAEDLGIKISDFCGDGIVNVTLSNGGVDVKTLELVSKFMYAYTEEPAKGIDGPSGTPDVPILIPSPKFSFHAPGRILG